MSALDAAERLKDDVSGLLEAGRTVAREYGSAGASFRRLVMADLALARTAIMRGLVFLLVAVILAGTAWGVAMVMIVVVMHQLGLHWLLAMVVPLVISLGIARYCWGISRKAMAFADLDATRRQLADWFPPTTPISTPSPTGEANPGPIDPQDPDSSDSEISPDKPT
jgi:hypothetical protein